MFIEMNSSKQVGWVEPFFVSRQSLGFRSRLEPHKEDRYSDLAGFWRRL